MTTSKSVRELVALAGGRIVGRTKLQKSACALELTGLGYGFQFTYRHFGPYSEELKIACGDADALGYIKEKTETATWGGWYSVFETDSKVELNEGRQAQRASILAVTNNADLVDLELAITAAYLATNGVKDPWREVEIRKSTKAIPERIIAAKALYKDLMAIKTPQKLPSIV
jgi:uncharacterized protein YwgA